MSATTRSVAVFGLLGVALLVTVPAASAAKVVLRIRAGNPIDTPQPVEIRANLPQRVSTNDILSLAGLDLGYDVRNDVYFVHKNVELGPREVAVFDVEINDIWTVSDDQLAVLEQQASVLSGKLDGTRYAETGIALRGQASDALSRIRTSQRANSIQSGADPIQHIQAYEENMQQLAQVRKDVGRLENLVLGTGQDPGKLVGRPADLPKPTRDLSLAPGQYKAALVRITVSNTSSTHERRFTLRRDLPPEVHIQDILDAGELQVGKDAEKDVCYVFKRDLELEPGQSLTFDVRIRDKWNVNGPRMSAMQETVSDLIALVEAKGAPDAIRDALTDIAASLQTVNATKGPETLDQEYVAFYRQQAETLDSIEERLQRVKDALKPMEITSRLGFKVKAPSPKTTWLLIYVILGFLAVLSVLFFLRWYHRTGNE
jgi:hypothetical protein